MEHVDYAPNTAEYQHLSAEERRIWRSDNFPRMTQHQVYQFYFDVIAPMEAEFGEDAIAAELDEDFPDLELQIQELEQEHADTEQRYVQLRRTMTGK
ncbi:hypothetical protein SS50377_26565 [Spironucleus salmonicida]|uniref:Uncharacterized protein n=1 Tax=Spironucleus salmonicida TaxID=348837 RepID=V6LL63_9EUKA|nr:hypothetical protein SS50377_26559 [Spironucleus salmonicida]KAH0572355.1 hypothetical protein SS50377_26565 [Spironucleus salmonicida]|eukprot:EST41413.1 Hypothetical protein SS50377_19130 [Spironucleus salmonicida]